MEDTGLTESNTIPHEVKVDFNMLRPLMLYRVGCHVGGTDVVTVDDSGLPDRLMQLRE
jgi:hypothetical protein